MEAGLLVADGERVRLPDGGDASEGLLPSERRDAERAHAEWFARWGDDEVRAELHRPDAPAKHSRIRAALHDVRAAMQRSTEPDVRARLALGVALTLRKSARWGELAAFLTSAGTPDEPALRRRLDWVWAAVERGRGAPADSEARLIRLLSESEACGDTLMEAEALHELFYLRMRDDLPRARALTERRLLIFSRLGWPVRAASALAELAMVDRMQGLIPMSAERFDQALLVLEAQGDPYAVLSVLVNSWPVLADLGRREEMERRAARALALADELDDGWLGMHAMSHKASALAADGRLVEAMACATAGLARWPHHSRLLTAWMQGELGWWRGLLGDVEEGMAALDGAHAELETLGRVREFVDLRRITLRRLAGRGADRDRAEAVRRRLRDGADPRGEVEAVAEVAWCALARGDDDAVALAELAVRGARGQSVALTCNVLLVLARARLAAGLMAAAEEAAGIGARLALRTGHLLDAALLFSAWADIEDRAGRRSSHRSQAKALWRDLALPDGCLLRDAVLGEA